MSRSDCYSLASARPMVAGDERLGGLKVNEEPDLGGLQVQSLSDQTATVRVIVRGSDLNHERT